jgi:hypothetical protein
MTTGISNKYKEALAAELVYCRPPKTGCPGVGFKNCRARTRQREVGKGQRHGKGKTVSPLVTLMQNALQRLCAPRATAQQRQSSLLRRTETPTKHHRERSDQCTEREWGGERFNVCVCVCVYVCVCVCV